jgi:hypothetical protein
VIAGQDLGEEQWRWRLYVPREGRFALYCRRAKSGIDDSPAWTSGPLPPGEYALTAAVRHQAHRPWSLQVGYAGQLATLNDLDDVAPRLPGRRPLIMQQCVGRTVVLDSMPGSRADLLAELDPETHLFGGTAENRGPGLRLWLEPLGP